MALAVMLILMGSPFNAYGASAEAEMIAAAAYSVAAGDAAADTEAAKTQEGEAAGKEEGQEEKTADTEEAGSQEGAASDTEAAGDSDAESEKGADEEASGRKLPDNHKIPEGVVVNNINLAGMTVAEAEERLEQLAEEICGGSLTLTVADDEEPVFISYSDFDMHVADSNIIEDICEIGTRGNLIKRYKELADVKNNRAEYELPFEYDHDKLKSLIDAGTAAYNREAKDATLVRHSGEFIITDEVTGIKVNVAGTLEAAEKALGEGWDGSSQTVAAVAEETAAAHTRAELEVITDLLGSYSTSYSSSTSNRIANIANGAALIDETVIYPGETFSFLDNVTPFTSGNGYYQATGYSGGKVVPSMGGGICQVSSTLYNAVLRAELEVVERANHGLTVGYVPLGADATVAEGSVDFKFRNNLDSAIYLEAYTWNGSVYTCIYGVESRPSNRSIEFYSVTEQTIAPGEDVITKDDTQPEGWQEVTQSAHNGYVASFYKYIYVDGELEDTVWINTSRYSATPRYVTVGTKKEKEDKKAETEDGDTTAKADND